MLPTPAELRDLSERFRQAVEDAPTLEVRQRLAAHAFALAQVAEQIERERDLDAFVREANIKRYTSLLAEALDPTTRATVQALLSQENESIKKTVRDVSAWRMRAEELRTTAENFTVPSVQETLRRAAANYEQMASHSEALLAGRRATMNEQTG